MHLPGNGFQSFLVLARQRFEGIDALGVIRRYLQQTGDILPCLLLLQAEVMREVYYRLAKPDDVATATVIITIITERDRA